VVHLSSRIFFRIHTDFPGNLDVPGLGGEGVGALQNHIVIDQKNGVEDSAPN